MPIVLQVALGGALGAMARYSINVGAMRYFGPGFPYATLCVNILGSFIMGTLITYLALRGDVSQTRLLPFLVTGFLGGFTTFSAFSLDAFTLFERGKVGLAALYVGGSVGASIAALVCGVVLVRGMMT